MKAIQMIVVISTLALFATSASGKSQDSTQTVKAEHHGHISMKSSTMHNNMSSMGELMQKISVTLKEQTMSVEQLKECAEHMERLSKLMLACAHDQKLENVEIQKKEIDNLTKEWDYFESQEFDSH